MDATDPRMLAARNGFIVLFVVLFGVSVYQFVTDGGFLAGSLWVLGAAVFYVSKYYYRYRDDDNPPDAGEESLTE